MVLLVGGGGVNWMMEKHQCGKEKQEEEEPKDKAKWEKAKKRKKKEIMKTDSKATQDDDNKEM